MKTLAVVTPGLSEYNDKLWDVLSVFKDSSILGYDHAEVFPLLLMSGASIRSVDQGGQLIIEIPNDQEECFYKELKKVINHVRIYNI